MNHKGTQTLKTERLVLRKILPEDAERMYLWMGDPEVCRYERWTPRESSGYTRGYINAVLQYEREDDYQWGIELDGGLIGSVCVVGVNDFDQKAIIGYCIAEKYWSCGYATEAACAVLDFMFTEVGINRIEASHSINNMASGRVLQKAGFLRGTGERIL
jgi:ribosomal-protein-alanine N-acetyltransferase